MPHEESSVWNDFWGMFVYAWNSFKYKLHIDLNVIFDNYFFLKEF